MLRQWQQTMSWTESKWSCLIIIELSKAAVINGHDSSCLLELTKTKDSKLLEIYENLLATRDFDTFIEDIIDLPKGQKPESTSSTGAASAAASGTSDTFSVPRNQRAIIDILAKANTLLPAQVDKINMLIDAEDAELKQIFTSFEQYKNLSSLLHSLKRIELPTYGLSSKASEKFLQRESPGMIPRERSGTPSTQKSNAATMASSSSPRWRGEFDEGKAYKDGSFDGEDVNIQDGEGIDDSEDYEEEEEEVDGYSEANEDDDNDMRRALDEDDKGFIEAKFLEIIQSLKLSPLETSALRLAISRDDEVIRSALEVFRANLNEEILTKSLREAVQKIIDEIKESQANFVPDNDNETGENISPRRGEPDEAPAGEKTSGRGDKDEEDDEEDDYDDENENDAIDEYLNDDYEETEHNGKGTQVVEECNDEEESEEDDEDDKNYERDPADDNDPKPAWLTSEVARNHIFPVLVSEMMKEKILNETEGNSILRLFQQGNASVSSALDRYDSDHDMSELVDTLQGLAFTFG